MEATHTLGHPHNANEIVTHHPSPPSPVAPGSSFDAHLAHLRGFQSVDAGQHGCPWPLLIYQPSVFRPLFVGSNLCILRAPHKTCRFGDAWTKWSSKFASLSNSLKWLYLRIFTSNLGTDCLLAAWYVQPLARHHCNEIIIVIHVTCQ